MKKDVKQLDDVLNKSVGCPVTFFNKKIGGKWKLTIIYHLVNNKLRFGQLSYYISDISRKVLTENLKEMEKDGLIIRTQYNEVPIRVEYSLTQASKDLFPLFQELTNWMDKYFKNLKIVDCPIIKRNLQNK